jgi:hypothetical protein
MTAKARLVSDDEFTSGFEGQRNAGVESAGVIPDE